jgi:hypothetical protein
MNDIYCRFSHCSNSVRICVAYQNQVQSWQLACPAKSHRLYLFDYRRLTGSSHDDKTQYSTQQLKNIKNSGVSPRRTPKYQSIPWSNLFPEKIHFAHSPSFSCISKDTRLISTVAPVPHSRARKPPAFPDAAAATLTLSTTVGRIPNLLLR